jgi:hypothetical protein
MFSSKSDSHARSLLLSAPSSSKLAPRQALLLKISLDDLIDW